MNEKSMQVLELPKILERLAGYASFSGGEELARELQPTVDLDEAQIWQAETAEIRRMFENEVNLSLGGVRDVRDTVIHAQRGIIIEPGVLLDIRQTLRRGTTLKRTVGRMKGQYPLIADLLSEVEECSNIQEEIARVVDESAEIRDTASPKLALIRRDLKAAFDRLQNRLHRIISTSSNQSYLQEQIITMRNGRYVVPIKVDHKGKIPGVVHDSSSSGATLFIEPLDTVELNNKWRELQLDEEKEIRRILLALTEQIGESAELICRTVDVLGYLDLVSAKARYADDLHAVEPDLLAFQKVPGNDDHPGSMIHMTGARHPLLSGSVVPIDVEFGDETWVLVVTGPNTGGKTVSLKTVGLLTLMAQCGLHLPADRARLSVFTGVYADIGDEQSIEQSLSTFSSHMTNTIHILRECDARSLVLLDEVGAGTDPGEGSALARALLNRLRNRSVTTMVTTHHPELKIYSVETPGVRNASVEFDLETLAPTYRLIVGLPGRSNALAIATRLGLPEEIIADAREMVTTADMDADALLDEIHRTREDIRNQQAEIAMLREELEQKEAELAVQLSDAENERRDIIHAARRNMQGEMEQFRRDLRQLRNEMRDAALPLEKLKEVQKLGDTLSDILREPVEDGKQLPDGISTDWVPRLGDEVYLETLKAEGAIIELDEEEAMVQVGNLKVRAALTDLRKPTRGERKARQKRGTKRYEPSNETNIPKGESPGLELDLRGARVEEAVRRLDDYLDAAYLARLPFARIIHGKGTGALRKAVKERVETHPLVSKVIPAPPKEGGEGVTIIHLAPLT